MKKLVILGSAAILSLMACTRTQELDVPAGNLSLLARTELPAESRTVVESGTHVSWEPGDEIAVFLGGRRGKFVTDLTSPSVTATFSGSLGEDAWPEDLDLWAVYPYAEGATFDGESITTALPAKQAARADSFGKDMNLSVAHATTNNLQFYNVCGGVRFSVKEEGIREVVLQGLDGEVLAGTVQVGFADGQPQILSVTDGKTSISLTPAEGETFQPDKWYYFVTLPGTLENGFVLHFRKADGTGEKVIGKAVTVRRSLYGTLTHVDEGAAYSAASEDNIVFKDTLVKFILTLFFDKNGDGELSYLEAALIHSFVPDGLPGTRAGEWVSVFTGSNITIFDELVYFTGLTRLDDGAFAGCAKLVAITIPETVSAIGGHAFNGCTSLHFIKFTAPTPPAIGEGAFDNTGDCPIIVPEDAMEGYVSAWPEYADRIRWQKYAVPEAVDLGLSVKWASFNLGATAPEESGDYFAWGDTEPYYDSLDPSKWKEGKEYGYHWLSYTWSEGPMQKMSKYCTDPTSGYNGFTDGKTVLDPEDDAVSATFGDNWRMPTDAEWEELVDNCTWTWVTRNGQDGRLFTGSNGNSIFLPAVGLRSGTIVYAAGTLAVYWSSSLYVPESSFAWQVGTNSGGLERGRGGRYSGYPLRPVYGARVPVESVSLNPSELELFAEETVSLTATVLPGKAHDKSILWSSSDESVATVSYLGEVTGVGPGTATVTVTTLDGGKTATCAVTVKETYTAATPEAVDLGLSVKWASFNLGATAPTESGDRFAWGETEPYYCQGNPSVWKPGKEEGYAWSSYRFNPAGDGVTFTKYTGEDYVTLQPEDDAASVRLGGSWRTPTVDEYLELRNRSNCDWQWFDNYQDSGVSGYLVTGKKEGYTDRSIFLAAPGGWGDLWTASLKTDAGNGVYAYQAYFYSSASDWSGAHRCEGYSIRPVSD